MNSSCLLCCFFFKFLCGLSSLKKPNRSNELFKKNNAGWIEIVRDMENITPTDENQSIDIAYSKNIDLTKCTLSKRALTFFVSFLFNYSIRFEIYRFEREKKGN